MKAKFENIDGIDYLTFRPECMPRLTMLPVILKGKRDGTNAWTWNGNLEIPTLRPSIRTEYANEKGERKVIHYWLNDGMCQCLDDCTDGNAGKTFPLSNDF